MVHAQSATIDMIMKGSSDDIARLIVFLQRKQGNKAGSWNTEKKLKNWNHDAIS
jgi:hypothetical protein